VQQLVVQAIETLASISNAMVLGLPPLNINVYMVKEPHTSQADPSASQKQLDKAQARLKIKENTLKIAKKR